MAPTAKGRSRPSAERHKARAKRVPKRTQRTAESARSTQARRASRAILRLGCRLSSAERGRQLP